MRGWAPIQLLLRGRLTLEVNGAEELGDPGEPTLIVANCASPADPSLVLTVLPSGWRSRTVVALPEDVPRWWRPLRRTVSVAAAADQLASGRHVLCFPEGRRSRDGFLAPFRADLAGIAISEQVGVVPVGIRGSYAAIPEDAHRPDPGRPRVSVRIGPLLRPAAGESAGHLAGRLHDEVRRLIEEDATTWWATQRNAENPALPPPTSSWRRIWAQTEAPTAGGRPRRPKIWRH